MCIHILNAQVSVRAPCCNKWFECVECHDIFMDHQMTHASTISFACLSCGMGFRKDLQLFGDKDEFCPHCENQYIIPAVTNERMLYEYGMDELETMLTTACERTRPIKTSSVIAEIGHIEDDAESVHSMNKEEAGAREAMEKRKTKLLNIKAKRKTKVEKKAVVDEEGGGEGGGGGERGGGSSRRTK
jgi:uncharacterized CHY-type Zn-finger protein